MGYFNKIKDSTDYKRINASEFLRILQGHDKSYIREDYDDRIQVKNFVITDNLCFTNKFASSNIIEIENCFFEKEFYLDGPIFTKRVSIENCFFDKSLLFTNATFSESLDLKFIHCSNSFVLWGGNYKRITFSQYDLKELTVYGGEFTLLDIGYWTGSDIIGEITILNSGSKDKLGNINIKSMKIGKLYLGGDNKGNDFKIENCLCKVVIIEDFVNNGNLKFFGLEPLKDDNHKSYFEISKTNLGSSQFYRLNFKGFDEVNIFDSYLTDSIFSNVKWKDKITAFHRSELQSIVKKHDDQKSTSKELSQIKETLRQLKLVMSKQGDKIQELKFYSQEMNTYNKLLPWTSPCTDNFWNKIILHLSRIFSDYGQSFLRPLIFLFVFNLIFFILIDIVSIDKNDWSSFIYCWGEYFKLINPLHKLDDTLIGWGVFLDLLSRIASSYFVFSLIRASRRFVK